ncbi:hypothetical protein [Paraburkholderia bannensis]|uniref:hypothetical protein n=1 Tax=Paraburkholderia bannensis TaxID=765414 RepID=UPI002ABE2578|nr:hypothetical protein [Paraburkholderia bannensis]
MVPDVEAVVPARGSFTGQSTTLLLQASLVSLQDARVQNVTGEARAAIKAGTVRTKVWPGREILIVLKIASDALDAQAIERIKLHGAPALCIDLSNIERPASDVARSILSWWPSEGEGRAARRHVKGNSPQLRRACPSFSDSRRALGAAQPGGARRLGSDQAGCCRG